MKEDYTILPYIEAYPLDIAEGDRIADWKGAWAEAAPNSFVLESGKDGQYTFLGLRPLSKLSGKGTQAIVDDLAGSTEQWEMEPLEAIRRWMAPYRAPYVEGAPKFTGGSVGFLSYDVARSIEKLPDVAADDLGLPDYVFLRVHELWTVDHKNRLLYCSVMTDMRNADADSGSVGVLQEIHAQAAARVREMRERWRAWNEAAMTPEAITLRDRRKQMLADNMAIDVEAFDGVRTAFPKERFKEAVCRIQQYIGAGDVFQVNLSMRQMKEIQESAEQLYEWLRIVNPSPYMGLLRLDEFQLVSCSPELLVKLERGEVSARPIAGTRRRGKTEAEDLLMAEELRSNEKERAEHIMLVDLERNDLGRISAYGSVRVDELMVIEYYSHVMHLVSEVRGKLADGKDAYDVIRAKFPGGTITGAPKVRTMEIIEELEPVRRGPYTGSFGWIDYTGDMELNIIIRTLTLKDGVGHIQAGAGIVIDSEPEREYRESLNKTKALWKAVQLSEREWKERSDPSRADINQP
ncbi:anthranilate synthase component I family protein [Paenibacillus marinisediminis]